MKERKLIPFQFTVGLLLTLVAATLAGFGILPFYARVAIGLLGLYLIATSNYRLFN